MSLIYEYDCGECGTVEIKHKAFYGTPKCPKCDKTVAENESSKTKWGKNGKVTTTQHKCEDCGKFELERTFMVKKTCPNCKGDIERIISQTVLSKMGDARTIAGQMDRNTSKMGRYELEAKRKKADDESVAKTGKTMKQHTEAADLRKKVTKLGNMNQQQQERYIFEGKE